MKSNTEKGKDLAYGTLIYAIGNLGSKVLSFLIVPLYTYYILPAEMGTYDLLHSTVNLLTPLITLQISDAAFVWMVQGKDRNDRCVAAVYKYLICMSALAALLISLVNCFYTIPYCGYFTVMLLTSRWMATIQKLARGLKKQKLFAASGVLYTVVYLLLNLIQIVILKQGVAALFQSVIISNIVVIVFLLCKEKGLRKVDWKQKSGTLQKSFLKFSIPVVPNQLNWWVINSSDRYIISWFIGSAANGIYAIAYKFPSMLQMIFQIFYQSWQDSALSDSDEDSGKFYTSVFRLYYKLGFAVLLPLIPFTKVFIELVMNDSYKMAAEYISFLYMGTVFQAFSNFMGVGYLKSAKTGQASATTIFGAIVNAAVNILSIHFIGLHAASISTFLSFFVVFFIRAKQTKPLMKVEVKWAEFFALFALAMIVTVSCIFTTPIVDAVIGTVGLVVFFLLNRSYIMAILPKLLTKLKKKTRS